MLSYELYIVTFFASSPNRLFRIILINFSYWGTGLRSSPVVAVIVIAQESLAPIS
jgi:hypothetical protein